MIFAGTSNDFELECASVKFDVTVSHISDLVVFFSVSFPSSFCNSQFAKVETQAFEKHRQW